MSAVAVGLALALAASVALNVGYLLQHEGSVGAPSVNPLRPLFTVRSLLASRVWAVGLVVASLGWAMHVGALARAPLSLVQAFVAGGLALAIPIGRRLFRQVLEPVEVFGIATMTLALVGLAAGIRSSGAGGDFNSLRLAVFLGVLSAGAGVLVALPSGARRAPALGCAGGLLYAAADVALKAITGVSSKHGLVHALLTPWLLAAVLATVGAFFCFQRGLQSGRALPVIALMTACTNAFSILAGFVVFGDTLGRTTGFAALHLVSFAAILAAATLLAPATSGSSRPS
jgi:hypothetical protein